MFTQIATPQDGSASGLGIGLTLVKSLVEMHGGTVEARSEGLGRGSEFVVRLPIASALPSRPGPASRAGRRPRLSRILVVDDNEDGARSLGLLLDMAGHEHAAGP